MFKEIAMLKIENKKKKDKIRSNAHNEVTKLPKFIHDIVKKNYKQQNDKYPLFLVIFFCSLGYIIGYIIKRNIF